MINSEKIIVYMLSGLGLDPAIFQKLDIKADEVYHLNWIDPTKNETLEHYAARMAKNVTQTEGKLILIGHSFGGVLMQEISKLIPATQIILISSIKSKEEKTAAMNFWMRAIPVHYLASKKFIISSFKSWGKAHGYDSPETQAIFRNAAAKHSSYYFKWATSRICAWQAKDVTAPILHIHGSKDKTFPHKKIKEPVTLIEGGDHVMVFKRAAEISVIINKTILEL